MTASLVLAMSLLGSTGVSAQISTSSSEELERLSEQIDRLQAIMPDPPQYYYEVDSVPGAVSTVWMTLTGGLTGAAALRTQYDDFFNSAVQYRANAALALIYARRHISNGDAAAARQDIQDFESSITLLNASNRGAFLAWSGDLEASRTVAEGIYQGSKASLMFAKYVATPLVGGIPGPTVSSAIDRLFIFTDALIEGSETDYSQAARNALTELAVSVIFDQVELEELGGRSLSKAIDDSVGVTVGQSGLYDSLIRVGIPVELRPDLMRIVANSTSEAIKDLSQAQINAFVSALFNSPKVDGTTSANTPEVSSARHSVLLEPIVSPKDPTPGRDRNFGHITEAVLKDGKIVFVGGRVNYGPHDLFAFGASGTINSLIAQNVSHIQVDGGVIYYKVGEQLWKLDGPNPTPLYSNTDRDPQRPSRGLGQIRQVVASGGEIAFSTPNGVYVTKASRLEPVATVEDFPPGRSYPFWASGFRSIAFDGTRVAFRGYSSGRNAEVFLWDGDKLQSIDDSDHDFDAIAFRGEGLIYERSGLDGAELVAYAAGERDVLIDKAGAAYGFPGKVGELYVSGEKIAFTKMTGGRRDGIYLLEDGAITEIFNAAAPLDGRMVQSFDFSGFEGETAIFIARWNPGYSDLYRATIVD